MRRNLELLLVLTRDLLLIEEGLEPRVAAGPVGERLRDVAGRYGLGEIDGWMRSIETAMDRLDRNVDPRLTLESLLLAHP